MSEKEILTLFFREAERATRGLEKLSSAGVNVETYENQLIELCDQALAAFFWADVEELRNLVREVAGRYPAPHALTVQ